MNHDQIKHLRSLRLLLSQDKAPLGFLLAAGCPLSVKVAGNPLLPDMAVYLRLSTTHMLQTLRPHHIKN